MDIYLGNKKKEITAGIKKIVTLAAERSRFVKLVKRERDIDLDFIGKRDKEFEFLDQKIFDFLINNEFEILQLVIGEDGIFRLKGQECVPFAPGIHTPVEKFIEIFLASESVCRNQLAVRI